MGRFIDLTGQRFGRLVAIKPCDKTKRGNTIWYCHCDCGNDVKVINSNLINGTTKSCGCYNKQRISETHKKYNKYDLVSAEYGIGWTSNTNEEFYFDKEDYDLIKDYCWRESSTKHILTDSTKGKYLFIHRLITDCASDLCVDHINHNPLDNRKSNLRIVSKQQNNMNHLIRQDNTSGCTGVFWDKRRAKWCANITYNHKQIFLGYFDDIDKAIDIRKKAEIKYFGKYRHQGEYINEIN